MTKSKYDYTAACFPAEGQPLNPPSVFDLDHWAECDTPQFEQLVAIVSERMQAAQPVQRWRKGRSDNLRLLLCNFIQNHNRRPGRGTRFYASPRYYSGQTHYRPAFVSAKIIPEVVKALVAADLAFHLLGKWDVVGADSTMSQAGPRPELISLWEQLGVTREMVKPSPSRPLIELRSKKRKGKNGRKTYDLVEPPALRTPVGAQLFLMRHHLKLINAHLAKFELWVPDEARRIEDEAYERWSLDDGCWRRAEANETCRWIDLADKQLRRVFNDVDPQTHNLDRGGRFYGGWWQSIPKSYRSQITIDGEPTVELDYASFHPRLIYHRRGIDYREDLYELGCAAQMAPGFDREKLRKAVKVLWLVALNSGPRSLAAVRRADRAEVLANWGIELPDDVHPSEVMDWIRGEHEAVAADLGAGVGLRLQTLDADLCRAILLHGVREGVPILPVHDSFIVRRDDEQILRDLMTLHYQSSFGFEPKIERKGGSSIKEPDLSGSI
ncbi:hypothetical protein LJR219_000200 [Phenylobacterium sp. LjRoot219]|uniref:hypothetical protein n=1 Tax=Phenylobacterium sp. LjRoot219 TaxID=3342283 RepID=UPI003ECE04DC